MDPATTPDDEMRPNETRMGEATPADFVQWLADQGRISGGDLARLKPLAEETDDSLHHILIKLGLISEADLAAALARYLGAPLTPRSAFDAVSPDDYPIRPRFLEARRLLPLAMTDEALVVTMADPLDDYARRALQKAAGRDVHVQVALPADIEAFFEDRRADSADEAGSPSAESRGATIEDDIERLRDLASEAPVVRIVNQLLHRAVDVGASDVHLEPAAHGLFCRYRIDGELEESDATLQDHQAAIISRIKIMAGLDIAERRLPQDGRIQLTRRGQTIDLRVSTVPFLQGEGIVLRVLDRHRIALDLAAFGFAEESLIRYREACRRPHGIVLVTGPTGSGKTSTLYASLTELKTTTRKIVTVEDPVEYELAGVNQIAVRANVGLTFAQSLRAILRHDPDVIMVGEIRDLETVQIAVQAALTGHLVLSTLHTNDAASTLTRLLEMGVADYLITATLNGVVAQRLARRLCEVCRQPYEPPDGLIRRLPIQAQNDPPTRLYRAVGCSACRQGFDGRLAVTEVMTMSDRVRKAVLDHAAAHDIQKIATEEGMRTLFEDGVEKARLGLTCIDEILAMSQAA